MFFVADFGMYSYGHQGGNWSYNKMHGEYRADLVAAYLVAVAMSGRTLDLSP